MKFSEAIQAIQDGKKVTNPKYFELIFSWTSLPVLLDLAAKGLISYQDNWVEVKEEDEI